MIFENEFPSAQIIAIEYIKTVLAGVGKPLKKFDLDFIILKRANLQAENKVIKKPKKGTNDDEIEPTEDEGA